VGCAGSFCARHYDTSIHHFGVSTANSWI
jgi:hypothetical protein